MTTLGDATSKIDFYIYIYLYIITYTYTLHKHMLTNLFRYKLTYIHQVFLPSNSESVPNPSITTNHLSPTTNKSETNRRPTTQS